MCNPALYSRSGETPFEKVRDTNSSCPYPEAISRGR